MDRNLYHSSLAGDGQDGNGLQLEKISQIFEVPSDYFGKIAKELILVFSSSEKSFHIFSLCCKGNFILQQNLHDSAPLKTRTQRFHNMYIIIKSIMF